MADADRAPIALGIAGLGNIGSEVARWLAGAAPRTLALAAVGGRDPAAIAARLASFGIDVPAMPLGALAARCDVVVDCLAPEAAAGLLETCIDRGGIVVEINVGVLLQQPEWIARARRAGTRLLVPSGAVAGVDALRAAAMGRIDRVRIRTRKPPAGLDGAAADGARQLFAGNAFEATAAFPRNMNIAATLALAGIGGERTEVEVWSDPTLSRNVHEVEIDSDSTRLTIRIENRPSAANPRSSALTAHSVCAALAGLADPLRLGA
jgi:aspartate dehydrogenase